MSSSELKIRPYEDRVIIEPLEETISKGGLVVPDLGKEKSKYGKVVAVGDGKYSITGYWQSTKTKVGDIVVYPKFGCHTIEIEGKEYLIIRESDLFALQK